MNIGNILLLVVTVQAAAIAALIIWGVRRARLERALRESEERFRRMIDSAPVMLWTARADATLDYFNHNCVEFSGLPIAKLLDNGWLDAVHPEDLDYCVGIYVPAIEARTPFHFEYRVRRADGSYRWLLGSGTPRYEPDGSFVGYIGCDVDITERRNAEDSSHESQAALEVSHQEIQQLAGQ
ncbi:MAG: PAS domain S-box protein, partial [Planctomycetaceae bacterium]|nr:PAS domain S-box protein [Planctomycetaceae bacterium]